MLRMCAVALLGLGFVACDNGAGLPSAPKVAAAAVPRAAAFRVVYRVEDTAGQEARISTDVIQVAEPWNGLLEHRDGPPPGGTVLSATVQNQLFTLNTAQGSSGFATRRIPGALTTAPSPEALEAAAAAGLIDQSPVEGRVAGEPCTQWTYKSPNAVLAKGTAEENVESCITGDGVPLREAITLRGRLVRVAEAVHVDRNPPVTGDTFQSSRDPGNEGEKGALLESEQQVTEGRRTGKTIVALNVPEGFKVSRQVTVNRQPGENAPPTSLYVQAFEQGTDLVTTEQVTTPGSPPWSAEEGQVVDLGGKRTGRIVYRAGWAEVRVTVDGKSVRVSSPRPAVALAVAKTLKV
ncbi:MAG TPA: hypothetical protein VGR20_14395 [Acidimicrobiia bacterium]|nr:hypothetical protein [Acidimicrobiia bacterium]